MRSAVGQDQIPTTLGYGRGEPLMYEARPSIATEMPADSFFYQPRSVNVPQHQEQQGYDELDTYSNPRYQQYVQGQPPMSVGVSRIPRRPGRKDATSAYVQEETMSQQNKGY